MKLLLKICVSITLTLAVTTLVSAETTFKWVDKNGTVHYSQQPPSDSNYERLNIKTQSGSSSTSNTYSAPTYSTPPSSNNSKADAVIKKQEAMGEEQRKKNCEAAKKDLQIYTTFRRIRTQDGKVIRLDDNKRAELIKKSKDQIKEFCQ